MKALTLALLISLVAFSTSVTVKEYWNLFKSKGLNEYGTAAMLGNIFPVSGLLSNLLQASYRRKLNLTSEEYTRRTDLGTYTQFTTDKAGYGLCQWSTTEKKTVILNKSKELKVSVGDHKMQVDIIMAELASQFPDLLNTLKTGTDVEKACIAVYESYLPAKDDAGKMMRRALSKQYYDKYHTK